MTDGYIMGHSPPWPANVARGISAERKWQTLAARKPQHRLVRLVADRELTDAQRWEEVCSEAGLPTWSHYNVEDVIRYLAIRS
jgi:hypothetical protein